MGIDPHKNAFYEIMIKSKVFEKRLKKKNKKFFILRFFGYINNIIKK